MNIISFIGNCQTLTLCFYLQQLLDPAQYKLNWLKYSDIIDWDVGGFAEKCRNRISDYKQIVSEIRRSNIIIYQEVLSSNVSNTEFLESNKKNNTILLKLPSIHLTEDSNSILALKERERLGNVSIKVTDILEKFNYLKYDDFMITINHPTTFFFMELLKELTSKLNLPFFSKTAEECFLKDKNYMQLPHYIPPKGPKIICHKEF